MKKSKVTLVGLLCFATMANAGFMDSLNDIVKETTSSVKSVSESSNVTSSSTPSKTSATATALSTTDMNSALKQALNIGVEYATKTLGAKDGYMNNSLVKISLPENMQKTAELVRKVGGDKYVDDLIVAINSAATEAAPKTATIFANSISKMTIDDAKKILSGSDQAATDYFRATSTKDLQATISPIIQKSMEDNSVAKYYDAFQSFYKEHAGVVKNEYVSGAANMLGYGGLVPSDKDENLNSFVTNKSIDGLMSMIQQKEKQIRANPLTQNSDLVKKVFSAF